MLASFLAFVVASLAVSAAHAADKMHVLIVQSVTVAGADIDALNIGFVDGMYRDVSKTEGYSNIVVQEKEGGTRKKIYEAIDEMGQSVGPQDVVLFYYSGHGAIDNKGHFLALDDRTQINRNELRQKLQNLGGRLTIIVSDCCAVLTTPNPPTAGAPDDDETIRRRFAANMKRLLAASGTVDMNSASQGQVAWGTKKGGLFTNQFTRTLFMENVNDWKGFTRAVSASTMESYRTFRTRNIDSGGRSDGLGQAEVRMLRNQANQQPHVFALDLGGAGAGVGAAPPGGVGAAPVEDPPAGGGNGVLVTRVNLNTTATNLRLNGTQMKLENGDRIVAINGQAISSSEEFGQAIDGLGRGAAFDILIIDGNSGKKMQMRGQLDVGGKYRFGITVEDK